MRESSRRVEGPALSWSKGCVDAAAPLPPSAGVANVSVALVHAAAGLRHSRGPGSPCMRLSRGSCLTGARAFGELVRRSRVPACFLADCVTGWVGRLINVCVFARNTKIARTATQNAPAARGRGRNHLPKTPMKNLFVWTGAFALVLTVVFTPLCRAGVIMVVTRSPQDTAFGTEYVTQEVGPSMATPGDVAMASLLNDHGYSSRLVLDKLVGPAGEAAGFPPASTFLSPANPDLAISLFIVSGSGASADAPPPPPGIPLMMGEHVTLGNNSGRQGSIYMYNGTQSNDPNESTVPAVSKYMKVLLPDHPILKGIPMDSQSRIKIWREPYPEEEAHVPPAGRRNFEFRWCTQAVADAAEGVSVLGVLDGAEDRSVFAVADVGANLANGTAATSRLVHMFMNENGSGGSRRVFYALTDVGRQIFVRAAKWAMGETLEPVQPFRIIDVTPAGGGRIKLSWDGVALKNYRILASTDLGSPTALWQTFVDDIPGANGVLSRTLDISAGPPGLFMQIKSLP